MIKRSANNLHPSVETLALSVSGDLGRLAQWKVTRHVAHCSDCERQVLLFRSAKKELRRQAETRTLTAFEAIVDWNRLEREMLGNIAVGVAAARCIEKVGRHRGFALRFAVVAGLTMLFVAGWLTHIPSEQTKHLVASVQHLMGMERSTSTATIVRTTPDGIAVKAQGATLTILNPPSAVVSLSGSAAVSARYVDQDSGEVTITKVYAQ
jgi:hypothetical protein